MERDEKLKFLVTLGVTSLSLLTVALTFMIESQLLTSSSGTKIFTYFTAIAGVTLVAGIDLMNEVGAGRFDILIFAMLVGIIGGIDFFLAQVLQEIGQYQKYAFGISPNIEVNLVVFQFVFAGVIMALIKLMTWLTEKTSDNLPFDF